MPRATQNVRSAHDPPEPIRAPMPFASSPNVWRPHRPSRSARSSCRSIVARIVKIPICQEKIIHLDETVVSSMSSWLDNCHSYEWLGSNLAISVPKTYPSGCVQSPLQEVKLFVGSRGGRCGTNSRDGGDGGPSRWPRVLLQVRGIVVNHFKPETISTYITLRISDSLLQCWFHLALRSSTSKSPSASTSSAPAHTFRRWRPVS